MGFDPKKHYTSVRMQQGRVLLDEDWNENERIRAESGRLLTEDIIGRHGTRDYVRSLQIYSLLATYALDNMVANVEAVKLADEIRKNDERLSLNLRFDLFKIYDILIYEGRSDYGTRSSEVLLSAMTPEEHLDIVLWLGTDIDFENIYPNYNPLVYKFLVARLTEEIGHTQKAISLYQSLRAEIENPSASMIDKAIILRLNILKN